MLSFALGVLQFVGDVPLPGRPVPQSAAADRGGQTQGTQVRPTAAVTVTVAISVTVSVLISVATGIAVTALSVLPQVVLLTATLLLVLVLIVPTSHNSHR